MADAESLPPPAVVQLWRRPPRRIVVLLGGCVAPDDVMEVLDRLRERLAGSNPAQIECDVSSLERADLATVDVLARLALEARRLGAMLQLARPSRELREMVALAGLEEVLPCAERSGLESEREAELREEPLGIEEERDPADPVAGQLDDLE